MGLVKPRASAIDVTEMQEATLDSADAVLRRRAAEACSRTPGREDELIARLAVETDASVREAIFLALATLASDSAIDGLAGLLADTRAEMRNGALETLRAIPAVSARLLPCLGASADPDVRIFALILAGELPFGATASWLAALIEEETDANVCAAAAEMLAEAIDPTAVPLLATIRDRFVDVPFVHFAATTAIARLKAR